MPFPFIPHPYASPPRTEVTVPYEELRSAFDIQSMVLDKMRAAHDQVQLPTPPEGYQWMVEASTEDRLVSNDYLIRIQYVLRRIDGNEEAPGQGHPQLGQ